MLGMCSCGFGLHSLPLSNLGSSVAMIYSLDDTNHRVLRYTPNELGTATLDSSINLPSGLTATLVTTDASGNLYIGGYTANVNHGEVLVYDAGATDDDAPLRTLPLAPGKLMALAVDRQRTIYAAQQNGIQQSDRAVINIYSSNAGEDAQIRIIDPSLVDLNDLAVDSAGHVYVSGWNGSTSFIREYAATASGAAAAIRTVWAAQGSAFGGLAVDDNGNIFTMVGLTIYKFATGTEGSPEPIQAINLPARFSAYTNEAAPNILRRDGLGDFFVPVTTSGPSGKVNMIYGFASNAGSDATPILQFIVDEATATGPHVGNIPLAVF
jgi:hypothetical protein